MSNVSSPEFFDYINKQIDEIAMECQGSPTDVFDDPNAEYPIPDVGMAHENRDPVAVGMFADPVATSDPVAVCATADPVAVGPPADHEIYMKNDKMIMYRRLNGHAGIENGNIRCAMPDTFKRVLVVLISFH